MSLGTGIEVQVRRRLSAAPEGVFDAWLTPRLLGQWMFGTNVRDEKIVRLDVDPRVGGTFSMLVERDGQPIDHIGTYLEIERPHRLAFTWAIRGMSDDGSRVAIDIDATADGCELTLTHGLPPRWADYAERTQQGWSKMLDTLQRLFGTTPDSGDSP